MGIRSDIEYSSLDAWGKPSAMECLQIAHDMSIMFTIQWQKNTYQENSQFM